MSRSSPRCPARTRQPKRPRRQELHIVQFRFPGVHGFQREATVLVRGGMGQVAALGPAYDQAGALGHGAPSCTGIRSMPAPRPTPRLDALCRRHTSFSSFVALLTAVGGHRPSLRLDLTGRDGAVLARAYDRTQAAWGDPRRAFATRREAGPPAPQRQQGPMDRDGALALP